MHENPTDAIRITDLSYSYNRNRSVLKNVSLLIPKRSIYGFLGPNGAGKTTTMRLLLGLLKNQSGVIRYFGEDFQTTKKAILYQVGSLIETPSLYQHLTATENLEIYRLTYGCAKSRIVDVLEIVGLLAVAQKKVKSFSQGMKQRLGIALALLHDPEILLLDEPMNGLDPSGIMEMRSLLKELNAQSGKTILMSSHLLDELEKTATHVGILNKGSVVFQGTLEELRKRKSAFTTYQVAVDDVTRAQSLLPKHAIIETNGNVVSLKYEDEERVSDTIALLVRGGVRISGITKERHDLENLFLELTK